MRALGRKLFRDVWQYRGQLASIAAVVAVGIMVVLTMRGTYESLVEARDSYYREYRLPDLWANLERAPESVRGRIAAIPGVAEVDTRVNFAATLDIPDVDGIAFGRFISIPDEGRPRLSDLHLRGGRFPSAAGRGEVLVSENFAIANDFIPGDTLHALLNGRRHDLVIVGMAISPEHTYAVPADALFPDDARYGIIWMRRSEMAPVFDMDGAFNEVALSFGPGASFPRVAAEVDRLLDPYGGLGAYAREDQPSYAIVEGELAQNRTMGTVIPAIFLGIAAFLLNLVLGRMVATQRTEIAVLKSFGYTDGEVRSHYLGFALSAVVVGGIVGVLAGIWLGGGMVELYADAFDFPELRYELRWRLVLIALGVGAAAAVTGAFGAVRRAVRLPAAEAMRPETPAGFEPGLLERLGVGRFLPAAGRMILRNLERRPVRSLMSAIGVSFSVAILVIGMFMFDGVGYMMDLQFRVIQREDVSVGFVRPLPTRVEYDLANLEGVARIEGYRATPVRLRAGHRDREVAIMGMPDGAELRRIVASNGRLHPLPAQGIVVSRYLADQLHIAPGDMVDVEILEGLRRRDRVQIAGVVEDFHGVGVYMRMDALHDLVGGPRTLSGAYLEVDAEAMTALDERLKTLPVIAGAASPARSLAAFEQQLAEGMMISITFILGFSMVIAVAVIYNGARISLSERSRELASLRVLGFTRREVAVLLLGEQATITLAAIPLGWLLGYLLAAGVSAGLQTEAYRIPLVVSTRTYVLAAALTILAALVSGMIVRRQLDRVDLIGVLKTRE